jgi:hypothetical protein
MHGQDCHKLKCCENCHSTGHPMLANLAPCPAGCVDGGQSADISKTAMVLPPLQRLSIQLRFTVDRLLGAISIFIAVERLDLAQVHASPAIEIRQSTNSLGRFARKNAS